MSVLRKFYMYGRKAKAIEYAPSGRKRRLRLRPGDGNAVTKARPAGDAGEEVDVEVAVAVGAPDGEIAGSQFVQKFGVGMGFLGVRAATDEDGVGVDGVEPVIGGGFGGTVGGGEKEGGGEFFHGKRYDIGSTGNDNVGMQSGRENNHAAQCAPFGDKCLDIMRSGTGVCESASGRAAGNIVGHESRRSNHGDKEQS